jgi:hypothetical protein
MSIPFISGFQPVRLWWHRTQKNCVIQLARYLERPSGFRPVRQLARYLERPSGFRPVRLEVEKIEGLLI